MTLYATGRPGSPANDLGVYVNGARVLYSACVASGAWVSYRSSPWLATGATAPILLATTNACAADCTTFVDGVSVQLVALPAPPPPPSVLVADGGFTSCGVGVTSYAVWPTGVGCTWTSPGSLSGTSYVIASQSPSWGAVASADGGAYYAGLQKTTEISRTATGLAPGATCA